MVQSLVSLAAFGFELEGAVLNVEVIAETSAERVKHLTAPNPSPQHPHRTTRLPGARHRAHARVEDRIKAANDSGLGRLPSRE